MNTMTGDIIMPEDLEKLSKQMTEEQKKEFMNSHIEMKVSPTEKQIKRKKVGRNEPCPCGSGKKFKRCCLGLRK